MVSYDTTENEVIENVKTISNDFKKLLNSEEDEDKLKVKKAIKTALMQTNEKYFDLTKENELFDYNEALAYYTAYRLFVLKNSLSFSLGGEHKGIKAGMLEVKNNSTDSSKNYDDNYYLNEWKRIIKKYFEKKNGPTNYGACGGVKRFRI